MGYLGFCEQIQQVGYHAKLTSLFSTNLKRGKPTISGIKFIISAEVIGIIFRVLRSFATHRDNLTSKSVFEVRKMNLTKVKEVFVNNRKGNKKILQFFHKYHILGDMQLSWRHISENQSFPS